MKSQLRSCWTFTRRHFSFMKLFVITFLFIMIFIDENSFLQSFIYNRKISQLEKEIEHYKGVIEESKQGLNDLQSNEENLEKFAREQYLMKKPNEDIYIIEKKIEE